MPRPVANACADIVRPAAGCKAVRRSTPEFVSGPQTTSMPSRPTAMIVPGACPRAMSFPFAPAARRAGIAGPFPADTVFVRALRGEFDAVIAPYHDVGMTAIKVAAFGRAVNVTLGLPFPRTSPDHGTAIDIAGRGIADASSMKESVRVCAMIARRLHTSVA